jgi:hypothetical protein
MTIGLNQHTSHRVVRLTTQETGSYNQQYSRPYRSVMDGSVIRTLGSILEQTPNGQLTSDSFSNVAGSVMAPSSEPAGNINIVNGWDTKRIRFLLQVEFIGAKSGVETHYILGYTDFSGVSLQGKFAPDMVFYINSIVQTRKTMVHSPQGMREVEFVVDSSQVLAENAWSGIWNQNQKYSMRPQDIVTGMAVSHLASPYSHMEGEYEDVTILDASSMLRPEAMKSRRGNNLASHYVSSMVNNYSIAAQNNSFGDPDSTNNTIETLNRTRSTLAEMSAGLDPFLHMLSGITNKVAGNSFTFGQLTQFDPNVDYVAEHIVISSAQQGALHHAGQTAYWNGSDLSTQAATVLSQSVPAIMTDLLISKVVFNSTNNTIGGRPFTQIIHGVGFSTMDMTKHWVAFANRFEREVMSSVTNNFATSYSVQMTVDLLGETVIKIAIANNPIIDFVVPSFCDNLLTPIITQQKEIPRNIAGDFEELFGAINEMHSPGSRSYDFQSNSNICI